MSPFWNWAENLRTVSGKVALSELLPLKTSIHRGMAEWAEVIIWSTTWLSSGALSLE
jgi:hypothetical protein